jgi:class 3 adenylate cyclase
MYCPECTLEVPDDSKFCKECGHHLTGASIPKNKKQVTESERKYVTILFSDLSGYTEMTERLDPEEVKEIMSLIFGKITEIIKKYDGFIERFIGDAIMAVFGVPKAHEDDPVRAVRAAMEIHEAVDRFCPMFEARIGCLLSMHSGINSGLVVTGEVDVEKGTHGLTGDAINLASRLEGIARAGEIIVGPETYGQAANYIDFEKLEPTEVKGKSEPVDIYKALSIKKVPFKIHRLRGLQAALTGRKQEMAILREASDRLLKGNGSIISICGDAGTGKSRLIREFKKSLNLDTIQWNEGHAHGYTQSIPYYPLINLLTYAFQIDEKDTSEEIRHKVESGVAYLLGKDSKYTPYIGRLFALNYTEVERISPDYWKEFFKESIQALLSALVDKGPTVICFEDLHWADTPFIDLIKFLLENASQKALFVFTFRPHFKLYDNNRPDTYEDRYTEILLGLLSQSDIQAMLKSLLEVQRIPNELYDFLQRKTEGNPFYIEEMINSLIESDILLQDNGNWHLSRGLTKNDVPATIQGILTARVDRLGKVHKRIIKEASVVGRAFLYKILDRITDLEGDVKEYLAGLESLDLIRTKSIEPDLEYIFKHALTQEVIYNGLLKRERQEIHERIALAIEQLFQSRLPEFYEILAHHFQKGHSTDKAVAFLMKAGDKCLAKFALNEAHRSFQEAYELLLANPQQWRAWNITLIDLLNRWSFVLYFQSDWNGMHRILSKHKETALNINNRATKAMYYAWLGWHSMGMEKYDYGEKYLLKALKIGEEIQDHKIIAYVYTWYSWILTTMGRCDEAVGFGKKAIKLAEDSDLDIYIHFKSRAGVAQAYWYSGDRLKSLEEGKKLVEFGQSQGSIPAITFGYLEVGASYLADGDFSKAIEWLQLIVTDQKEFIYYHAALLIQGMAYFLAGEFEKAEFAIRKTLEFVQKDDRFPWLGTPAKLYLGGILIAQGRMSEGMKTLLNARKRSLQTGYKYVYLISEYMLGNIFLQMTLGEGDISFGTIMRNIGFLVKNLPYAKTKAETHLKKTIILADEISSRNLKGQALFDLGRLYLHRNRKHEAQKCLMEAIEVFEQCGIETYKRQAEKHLSSLH